MSKLTSIALPLLLVAGCGTAAKQETTSKPEPVEAQAAGNPDPSKPDPSKPEPSKPEPVAAAPKGPAVGDLRRVGRVDFRISCEGQQAQFDRAMALLHSFFYGESRRLFTEVTKKDPDCAIAHWGIAMTWYHPLWAPPNPEEMGFGIAAIEKAQSASKKSPREQGYVDALAVFYKADPATLKKTSGPTGMSCHGPTGDHSGRANAYTQIMQKLFTANPDDTEAAAFYALALLGSAKPVDPKLENQNKAAQILEKLWVNHRDHPGVAHYLIHSYDFPPLAQKGLDAAKAYTDIAPWVPHALHMPSHIFVRLGMWGDSIRGNIGSADAARNYLKEQKLEGVSFEELHALDYLIYSYLQTGQEAKAKAVAEYVTAMKKTYPEIEFAASYAAGAIPSRFAVERHAWKEAAALTVPTAPFWKKFPFAEAHIEYARGMGRARSGDVAGAKQSLVRLGELREATNDPKYVYFKDHLALQHQAVGAWVAQAEGKTAQAIAALRKAAQMEDRLGKNPVSPGPINIMYEQLGDLLLQHGKAAEALAAYETALKSSPRRLNSVLGAGLAAEKAKKLDVARKHFQLAVDQTAGGDMKRPELDQATAFLAKKP
jgi:tetratricopeptide (TPR) repeat protein